MSDQHSLTRKTILAHSGIFSVSSVGYLVSLVLALTGTFSTFDILAAVSFVLSLVNMRGAWKGFSDMEYGKANQSAWIASITSIGAAIMGLLM
jgi:hypothetical protein